MEAQREVRDLGIADRLTRSRGRTARDQNANARLTKSELAILQDAARSESKALGEWTREVLLRHARQGRAESAAFTELIALRMLLNAVLRSLVLGKKMTETEYNTLLTELRKTKHATAQDVLAQYQTSNDGVQ